MRSASAADMRSPLSSQRIDAAFPAARTKRCTPLAPGMMPKRTSGCPSVAPTAAQRKTVYCSNDRLVAIFNRAPGLGRTVKVVVEHRALRQLLDIRTSGKGFFIASNDNTANRVISGEFAKVLSKLDPQGHAERIELYWPIQPDQPDTLACCFDQHF